MQASSFLPRTRSKTVFVIVMTSYSLFAAGLLRTVANAFGAQRTQPGVFFQHGHPTLEALSLLILAPLIESLILIAMIELLRWLRSPTWLQIGLPALISAAQHVPVSHAVVVAPSWFIMASACDVAASIAQGSLRCHRFYSRALQSERGYLDH